MLPLESSLPQFRISPVWKVIGCIPVILFMYWLFGNPDADFRSSDSNWANGELSFKAFKFEGVVFSFETYRVKCQADSAQFVRTTKMRWWNVFAWHSYLTNPKWKVPYGKPDARIGSAFPQNLAHCANRGLTFEEIELVRKRSTDLVKSYANDT